MTVRLMLGDCRERMKELEDASVDSIVCDPPYDLTKDKRGGSGVASVNLDSPYGRARIGTGNGAGGFMGQKWDGTGVAFDAATWLEAFRVLKPGGYVLAFGGTRTFHKLASAIEAAGFEIRDQIANAVQSDTHVQRFISSLTDEQQLAFQQCLDESSFGGMLAWTFAQGFPKNMDVSKAIDRHLGATRTEVAGVKPGHEEFLERTDASAAGGRRLGWERPWREDPEAVRRSHLLFAPATPEAQQWRGWGTALKPSWEPIVVARKPHKGTVAANVLKFGTGAMNVDACKVPIADKAAYERNCSGDRGHAGTRDKEERGATFLRQGGGSASPGGRWPANLVHDGSEEVEAAFPTGTGARSPVRGHEPSMASSGTITNLRRRVPGVFHGDSGSAARFFHSYSGGAWNRSDAAAAACRSSLQSALASTVLGVAATWGSLEGSLSPSGSMEPSTTVTASEFASVCALATEAILSFDAESSREWRQERPSPSGSRVSVAITRKLTGTTTITASLSRSDGSAGDATFTITPNSTAHGDQDSARKRLFYSPKATARERHEGLDEKGNEHPTVKPTDLMRWLVRLVTPPGGVVLDPFAGSGSTLKAAELEGFSAIGIELEPAYLEIARRRIAADAPLLGEVHVS